MDDVPDDRTAKPARAQWPTGLIAMLGLVAAIELTLGHFEGRFQGLSYAGYGFTRREIPVEAPEAKVLVIGDSLLKFGVQPRVLQDALGLRAFNLAHIGGQPPDTYYTLRRALASGAKPEAIVVDFKANILQVDPRLLAAERTELYDMTDCVDMGWTCGSLSYGSEMLVAKVLPSVKYRAPIRGEILAAFRNVPWAGRGEVSTIRRNWEMNKGAHVVPPNPAVMSVPVHWDEPAYLVSTFASHPINHRFVERTLKLASDRQIPVYWLIPPILPRVQAWREQMGVDAVYLDYVRSFLSRYPNLTVVDGRHCGYEAPVFVDAAHLDRVGGSAFSTAIAEVIGRGKDAPRWVDMPIYHDPKSPPKLEDMNQSRVAVQGLEAAVRVLR